MRTSRKQRSRSTELQIAPFFDSPSASFSMSGSIDRKGTAIYDDNLTGAEPPCIQKKETRAISDASPALTGDVRQSDLPPTRAANGDPSLVSALGFTGFISCSWEGKARVSIRQRFSADWDAFPCCSRADSTDRT